VADRGDRVTTSERRSRLRSRPDPPDAWLPAASAAALLCALALSPLVAQAIVGLAVAGHLTWPDDPVPAFRALRHGEFGTGLDRPDAAQLPPGWALWSATGILDVLIVLASIAGVRWWWISSGPGAGRGIATAAQARQALGERRLRSRRRQLRPDLYPRRRARVRLRLARPAATPRLVRRGPRGGPGASRGGRPGLPVDTASAPTELGWRLGRAGAGTFGPLGRWAGPALWVPYDRTTGVVGPQGSGKTLDLLAPALLDAPGAALVTLTKPEDLFLTLESRRRGPGRERDCGDRVRPVVVLDPFDLAPGLPELVWDPVVGCEDPMTAERRAKAFTAGTVGAASTWGTGDQAARFYAAEAAKVLQAYLHAAALDGCSIDMVLKWVANPRRHPQAEEILRLHPGAAPFWDGLLRGALHGDERTAGNTITTVQQALGLFFQTSIRQRCTPSPGRPATDLPDLIRRGGTIYLMGREDPYASASPLMTAVAEHVLDTALAMAMSSVHGRLCPPFLACLDELPSTTPLPTLRTRMANERALGLSFVYAFQTWRQLAVCYGEDEARSLLGLSNNLVVFGGGKDVHFYRDVSDLLGVTRVSRASYQRARHGWGTSWSEEDVPILRPEEIRRLPDRTALVVSEQSPPILAALHRCLDGRRGRGLARAQLDARARSRRAAALGSVTSDA
jgi:type IV secretion system protein VirD4